MRLHTLALGLSLALLVPLSGCGRDAPPPAGADPATAPSDSLVTRGVQAAIGRAAKQLEAGNITVGGKHNNGFRWGESTEHLPRAEITPKGDLLIEGKAVAVDARQRELLLAYRARIIEVAKAGMAIGVRGANLGVQAAQGALKAAFSGSTDEFGKQMEAEGKQIEREAQQTICARLPELRQAQDALAAALPEFVPYATLDQNDVEKCGTEGHPGGFEITTPPADTAADPDTAAGTGTATDAAAEADAAARDPAR